MLAILCCIRKIPSFGYKSHSQIKGSLLGYLSDNETALLLNSFGQCISMTTVSEEGCPTAKGKANVNKDKEFPCMKASCYK